MSDLHGRFVWYELMADDLDAATAFYGAVIGWKAEDSGMPDMEYRLFKADDIRIAGLMNVPQEAAAQGMKPSWMGYVATSDVDSSAADVSRTGGFVHKEPTDIPGVGRFAICSDPQGAMFAMITGISPTDTPELDPDKPGHGAWSELFTEDSAKAFDFYAALFGWTRGPGYEMGPMGIYQLFNVGDLSIGGMMNKPAEVPFSSWNHYFTVDGIDAALERVTANGGKHCHGPAEVPGGMWVAQCNDPEGAFFGLVSAKR